MKNKIFSILTTLLVLSGTHAYAKEVRIAHARIEYIIGTLPESTEIRDTLIKLEQKLADQLNLKVTEVQARLQRKQEAKVTELQQQTGTAMMTASAKQQKQKEFEAFMHQLQKQFEEEVSVYNNEAKASLIEERNKLVTPVQQKVNQAVEKVAKSEGYTHVYNKDTETTLGIPTFLYVDKDWLVVDTKSDISDLVLTALGINLTKLKIEKKAKAKKKKKTNKAKK